MSARDLLAFALGALSGHRLRTALSLLGVTIGVSAVLLLTALGEGARRYVTSQFEALGTSLLIVIPGRTDTAGALPGLGKPPNDLTLLDAEAMRRALPGARGVVPLVMGTETVAHRERSRQVPVVGTTAGFKDVRHLSVARGEFLPAVADDRVVPVVVLGRKVAAELFPDEEPLGKVVRIGDWRTRVVGVLGPKGTQLGMDVDDVALVPVAAGMRIFDRSSLFRVLIDVGVGRSAEGKAELERAQRRVLALVKERHGEEDVTVITQDSVLGAFSQILKALTAFLAGIASVSLGVAGLGIMNVMLVSVSERTSEVGLLKALGATNGQVLRMFLAEAAILAGLGGLLGVGLALALTSVAGLVYPEFPLTPPAWAVAAALLVAVLTGLVFGVLPARRATRLDPVAALGKR